MWRWAHLLCFYSFLGSLKANLSEPVIRIKCWKSGRLPLRMLGALRVMVIFFLQQWRWNVSGAEQEELNFDEAKDKTNRVMSAFLNFKGKIKKAVILWVVMVSFPLINSPCWFSAGTQLMLKPKTQIIDQASSLWASCFQAKCPACLFFHLWRLRVIIEGSGVTVMGVCVCFNSRVTAHSAVCLWWWRLRPGLCWHHWYTPTDHPSTPSTALPCCLLLKQPVYFQWSTSWRATPHRWTCGAVWPSRCCLQGRHTSR